MEFDKLAKQCRKLAYEGKDYEAILSQISIDSLPEKEQKDLLSLIDDFIVQYNLAKQIKAKHIMTMMIGLVALLVGLFIIIIGYIRGENQLVIGSIACLIGLYIIKNAYHAYQQPIDIQPIAPVKDSKFRKY